jgi:cell wall assembly regulator SMI1
LARKDSSDVWELYTEWLRVKARRVFANLAPPASAEKIAAVEKAVGRPLPKGARRILSRNDGQRRLEGCPTLPGLRLLSCERIIAEWKSWASTRESEAKHMDEHDAACSTLDPGVRRAYTVAGWIPLFQDGDRADYFGIDLSPTKQGKKG